MSPGLDKVRHWTHIVHGLISTERTHPHENAHPAFCLLAQSQGNQPRTFVTARKPREQ
jgi:hypothetical protein